MPLTQFQRKSLLVISTVILAAVPGVAAPLFVSNFSFETLPAGALRHKDHRFEWTREEFQAWANSVSEKNRYSVAFLPVGPEDSAVGAPTQMGIFRRSD